MAELALAHQVVGWATAIVIGLLSLPGLARALAIAGFRSGYHEAGGLYSDRDGVATEASTKAYTWTRSRLATWFCVVTGLGACIASSLVSIHTSVGPFPWLDLVSWLLISIQCASLPTGRQYRARFRLAILALISSLGLALSLAFRYGYVALSDLATHNPDLRIRSGLYLLQISAAFCAYVSLAGIPRRPNVYYQGRLVEQRHTASLLSRLFFSWDHLIFDIAKQRQVQIDDIPVPDAKARALNLHARFLARGPRRMALWKQLIFIYRRELAFQWCLTIIITGLSVFPQIVMYNFLSRIEARQNSSTADVSLLVWVLGLLVTQFLQVVFVNRLKWATAADLEISVGAMLQSLVFSKALRQHEVTSPPSSHKDDNSSQDGDDNSEHDGQDSHNGGVGQQKKTKKHNKAMNIEKKKKKKKSSPQQSVINHMKLDSSRVTLFCQYNADLPMALFKLVFSGAFMVHIMGWKASLVGFGAALLIVPTTTALSRKYGSYHFSLMEFRDRKANILSEALQGMRQIRFSALERLWEDKILASREEELKQFRRVNLWSSLMNLFVNIGPLLLASSAFVVYVWEQGTNVRASVIFSALGLFDAIDEAVALLPLLQMYMIEAYTSCARLDQYLSGPDREPVSVHGPTIAFEDVTVSWPLVQETGQKNADSEANSAGDQEIRSTLRDVSLEFPPGRLSIVTGKSGAGKSLLLASILGEVKLHRGKIQVPQKQELPETSAATPEDDWVITNQFAFVSQSPWIEGGTVRENVLFGLPMIEHRYRMVLHACGLDKDIELLVDADQTEVGPKGVTLSGGQRWRIALARAVYSRAGILVLDDVLSAVDAHVGKRIAYQALSGRLASGRTIILATHHADLVLPLASYAVHLRNGRVVSAEHLAPTDGLDHILFSDQGIELPAGTMNCSTLSTSISFEGDMGEQENKDRAAVRRKEKEEKRVRGRVKRAIYWAYFRASGGWLWWISGICIVAITHLMTVFRTWSLKELADQHGTDAPPTAHSSLVPQEALLRLISGSSSTRTARTTNVNTGADEEPSRGVMFWVGAYVLVYLAICVWQAFRVMFVFFLGQNASRALFRQMTRAILRSPLRWLDTVPAGIILNRFTSDIYMIDRRLPTQIFTFFRHLLMMIVIISASLSVSWHIVVFAAALIVIYARIASEYIVAAREAKRINSVSHSPIYDQLATLINGLSTVRAYGRQEFYMNKMYSLIDTSQKANWIQELTTRWMNQRLSLLGGCFVAVVALSVALGGTNAALAGFSMTFANRYTNTLTSLLRVMTSVELGFNACERVLEYANLETESEDGRDPPAAWPAHGKIEVNNLTVAYAETLPTVLKNVSFTIKPGERIGVLGRTGAGKSTLASVLFRLLEPREGSIHIDGLDISDIKLAELRSRLAVIPQDPFLFSGTLRSNLDMAGTHDDQDILLALRRVRLIGATDVWDRSTAREDASNPPSPSSSNTTTVDSGSFSNLSMPISVGGGNLSQGQRQLVCLARALLQRPKILVMDEATSAVDKGTDAAMQASLRQEFTALGSTVLVIAHRLSTVADFDRLLVLDKGRVAEIGTPKELLQKGMARARARAGHGKDEDEKPGEYAKDIHDEGTRADVAGEASDHLHRRYQEQHHEQLHEQQLDRDMSVAGDQSEAHSESGSTTQVDGEEVRGSASDTEDSEVGSDEEGTFWTLVQKSAEKERIMDMILHGKDISEVS